MELNKGLNFDDVPNNSESGEFHFAKNITIDSTYQFPINEHGFSIVENISLNNISGIIHFDKGFCIFNDNTIYVVRTDFKDDPIERIVKKITIPNLTFNKDYPIRGIYSYNQRDQLIIVFSSGVNGNIEDMMINIDSYEGSDVILTDKQTHNLKISLDILYPKLNLSLTNGSLMTGTYMVAMSYKDSTNTYTNFSPVSLPTYVYGTDIDGLKPTLMSNKGISINIIDADTRYDLFRLAILYHDGVDFIVRYTKDLSVIKNKVYTITTIDNYTIGSLSDVLVNTAAYTNSEAQSIMSNQLFRANVKSIDYKHDDVNIDSIGQELANNMILELKRESVILDSNNYDYKTFKKDVRLKFQDDEVYALYLTLGDIKGNIIGTYPISTSNLIGDLSEFQHIDGIHKLYRIKSLTSPEVTVNNYNGTQGTYGRPDIPIRYDSLINTYYDYNRMFYTKNGSTTLCSFGLGFGDNNLTIKHKDLGLEYNYPLNPFFADSPYYKYRVPIDVKDSNNNIVNSGMYYFKNDDTDIGTVTARLLLNKGIISTKQIWNGSYINYETYPNIIVFNETEEMTKFFKETINGEIIYRTAKLDMSNTSHILTTTQSNSPVAISTIINTYDKIDMELINNGNPATGFYVYIYYTFKDFSTFDPMPYNYHLSNPVTHDIRNGANYCTYNVYMASANKSFTFDDIDLTNPNGDDVTTSYSTNYINASLPNNYLDIINDFSDQLGFWYISRAERNFNNSRIINQGILHYDVGQTMNSSNSQMTIKNYNNANAAADYDSKGYIDMRYYSFEDLFNRANVYNDDNRIEIISKFGSGATSFDNNVTGYFTNNLYSSNIEKSIYAQYSIDKADYIMTDNVADSNYRQESTNRLRLPIMVNTSVLKNSNRFKANIIRYDNKYYYDIFNQKLAIASAVYTFNNITAIVQGDTFLSMFVITRLNIADGTFDIDKFSDETWLKTNVHKYKFAFIIESKYNISARYWENDEPKYDDTINNAIGKGYNTVYNKQSDIQDDVIQDIDIPRVNYESVHKCRIIKSGTSNLESDILNWKIFKVLDYYDMPYNRNGIMAIHCTYKNMYIQQELALSIASIKDVLSYTDGSTYVGSGQLFDRIPSEVAPTPYGYIGCEGYFNTGINEMGYWVIDNKQSNVFWITDNSTECISAGKNANYIKGKLHGSNPYKGDCSYLIYDMGINAASNIKRFIIVSTSDELALSYVPALKKIYSTHTYIPNYSFATRDRTYYYSNFNFYKNDNNKKCDYFGKIEQSIISIYYNDNPINNKLIESIIWDSIYFVVDTEIWDKTFDHIMIHTDSQCSAIIDINKPFDWMDSDSGVFKTDLWLFNNINDYVIDNKKPFLYDYVNQIITNIDTNKEWFNVSKLRSQFACVTLFFDNQPYLLNSNNLGIQVTKQPSIMLKYLNINVSLDNR